MEILIMLVVVLVLDGAAWRWGVDSRGARPAQNGSDAPFRISLGKGERRISEKKTNVFQFPK
jgi:hypothetical protein